MIPSSPLSWAGFFVGVSLTVCPCAEISQKVQSKPNVILFLVDDMGWMDSSVYGSEFYETPNMERLAKEGMVFTDAYTASPLCSPTRASILTGKYPARTRFTHARGARPSEGEEPLYDMNTPQSREFIQPRSETFMALEEYTLAEALRDGGYRTAHLGKWHIGHDPEHWPERQGFQSAFHCSPDAGPPGYFSPYEKRPGTITDGPEGEYITDRLTQEAMRFIETNKGKPFFLNLWHYGVHGPWGHKQEFTEYFKDKTDPTGRQGNPIMASMLKSIDESLGKILNQLDALGLADNTLFIFYSDNGGNTHSFGEDDEKTIPSAIEKLPKKHKLRRQTEDWRHFAGNSTPTSNAPLRDGKGAIYEGGVRVPLIFRWPGKIPANSRCSEPVCSIDIYPTVLQAVGLEPNKNHLLDGVSLWPVLAGESKGLDRKALFFYFPHALRTPPGIAVRQGDWKLIRWFGKRQSQSQPFELYNLKEDLGETANLADSHTEKVAVLNKLIEQHFEETVAAPPIPNPNYKEGERE